ncbi:hypothetical protein [Amycolatopsis sp. NPDC004625]|uniref:hypothetical protein n=1 Tax=Amycolatopsis sp. NPDC004625 TaxID=3154670 RepID=UPI0033BA8715
MTIRSAAEFISLRDSEDPELYRRAAHDDAPIDVWRDLVDHYAGYRKWVAHNKTVPADILHVLATDEDQEVRFFVAMKRRLPLEILDTLSRDTDDGIRLRVARNKTTSQEILWRLAKDPSKSVRDAVHDRLEKHDRE